MNGDIFSWHFHQKMINLQDIAVVCDCRTATGLKLEFYV